MKANFIFFPFLWCYRELHILKCCYDSEEITLEEMGTQCRSYSVRKKGNSHFPFYRKISVAGL